MHIHRTDSSSHLQPIIPSRFFGTVMELGFADAVHFDPLTNAIQQLFVAEGQGEQTTLQALRLEPSPRIFPGAPTLARPGKSI
jgi:hypothetical protein